MLRLEEAYRALYKVEILPLLREDIPNKIYEHVSVAALAVDMKGKEEPTRSTGQG